MQTITRTFGTTTCAITVRAEITPLAPEPAYTATATVAGQPVLGDDGAPLERTSGTEDGAINRIVDALERRFGPLA